MYTPTTRSDPFKPSLFQTPAQNSVDLVNYRTSDNHLLGLQPDRQGIYTRMDSNGNTSYFTRIEGNTYQVGNFQMQEGNRPTWGLIDPRTGDEVLRLEKEGSAWQPMDPMRASTHYAAGPEGRIQRANDDAIRKVEHAITRLHEPWDPRTTDAMVQVFGPGILTPEGKGVVEQRLRETLKSIKRSHNVNGADEWIDWNVMDPSSPAGVSQGDGPIGFSGWAVTNENDRDFTELVIHEHAHRGGGTGDRWYQYSPEGSHRANYGGGEAPFTFENAANNADSIKLAVRVLNDGSGPYRPTGSYSAPPEPRNTPPGRNSASAVQTGIGKSHNPDTLDHKANPVGQPAQFAAGPEFNRHDPGKADDWAVEGAELHRLVQEHISQERPQAANTMHLRAPNAVAGAVAGLYALSRSGFAPAAWHHQSTDLHATGIQAAVASPNRIGEIGQHSVSDDLLQDRIEIRKLASGGRSRATLLDASEQNAMHTLSRGGRDALDTEGVGANHQQSQHLGSSALPEERRAISDLAHGRTHLSRTERPTRSQPHAELSLER